MSQIVTILLPFMGLIACGFVAGKFLRFPAQGISGLNLFIYYFALPAWFFQLVAETPFASMAHWSFVVVTTFATYCAFAIAFSFGALVNRGNVPEATIQGLVGSYANIGYLAPALTVAAFGPEAAAPTALVFTFDSILLFAWVPLMMALGGTGPTNGRSMVRAIGRRIALHPFILATVAGLAFSAVGLSLPGPVDAAFTVLRSSAAPVTLFTVGVSLAMTRPGRITLDTPVLLLLKLVLHPLIVYLLLSYVGGYDRTWVYAAVLMAALPPAANVIALAERYDSYRPQASMAVYYGTIASFVTITATLVLLLSDGSAVDPFR